jgi:hypothetical protein
MNIQLNISNHDFLHTMSCKDIMGVHRLSENNPHLVLQFIVNILSIVGATIMYKLLPLDIHLICCRLLTIVKHICAKIGTHTYLCRIGIAIKLLPLPQPPLRVHTDARTSPSAQRVTQLRSVLSRVYAVARQNQIATTVP